MIMRAEELSQSHGYIKRAELILFVNLVRSLPDNPLIVNIGCGVGTSGLAILEARDDSFLVSVDEHDKTRPEGALGNERFQVKRSSLLNRRGEIHSDSARAGNNWKAYEEKAWWCEKIDMVFHDACHGYETLSAEIKAWLPHVKSKGIIAVHDYSLEYWGGVIEAVDEILLEKYEFIEKAESLIAFRKEKRDSLR